jgi:hypothetical protein
VGQSSLPHHSPEPTRLDGRARCLQGPRSTWRCPTHPSRMDHLVHVAGPCRNTRWTPRSPASSGALGSSLTFRGSPVGGARDSSAGSCGAALARGPSSKARRHDPMRIGQSTTAPRQLRSRGQVAPRWGSLPQSQVALTSPPAVIAGPQSWPVPCTVF